jgi:hypothetical protein
MPGLFVSLKEACARDAKVIPDAFRQVENYLNSLGSLAVVNLPSDTAIGTTATTLLTTPPLAAGIWLVSAGLTAVAGAATTTIEMVLAAGTAAVLSFAGQPAAGAKGGGGGEMYLAVHSLITITAPGTVILSAVSAVAASTAKNLTLTNAFPGAAATGLTCLKVG